MVVETDLQRKIVEASEKQGGFGMKWASEWQAGPPDLILAHPALGAYFMEVKLIKLPTARFDLKIETTKKQKDTLKAMFDAGAKVCVGVVVYHGIGKWDLVVKPHWATRIVYTDILLGHPFVDRFRSNGKDKQPLDLLGLMLRFFDQHPPK